MHAIKRVNTFEREWIENVRYEIYWKDKMAEVIEMLRQHVKYARVQDLVIAKRYRFLFDHLAKKALRNHQKWVTLRNRL
jgi:transcription initiation factor TFIIIB Brf1 subunit/transcription initiation factor TFIIB